MPLYRCFQRANFDTPHGHHEFRMQFWPTRTDSHAVSHFKELWSVVCRENSDCEDGGEICQGGKCVPGCRSDADCKEEENCQDGSCVDICKPPNSCGTNALCKGTKHRKECSCPPDYLGDPEVECLPDGAAVCQTKGHCKGECPLLEVTTIEKHY